MEQTKTGAMGIVLRLALLIAVIEFLVMGLLVGLPLSPLEEAAADALLLTLFLAPLGYLLLYRPLRKEILVRQQAEIELRSSLDEQRSLNAQLTEMTDQLLESEKLVSMGQLAAGVAHEINNPIGYVSSNFGALNNYCHDLFQLLSLYENAHTHLRQAPELWQAIEQQRSQLDVDFLKEDIQGLIDESQQGLQRVRTLVQNLKDFSRSDEGVREKMDLNEELERALSIVHNELKYHTHVEKALMPDLPKIEGVPSQVNQVFVNILVNAGQAIADKGEIRVATDVEAEFVRVRIADTGCGIGAEQMRRLFEPFYTTKPRGKGTGLGLSVSWGIVQKHGGRIDVESEPGVGTTFHIRFPFVAEIR